MSIKRQYKFETFLKRLHTGTKFYEGKTLCHAILIFEDDGYKRLLFKFWSKYKQWWRYTTVDLDVMKMSWGSYYRHKKCKE